MTIINIDDYTNALDFIEDAALSKSRFTFTDLLLITGVNDTIEVSLKLNELISLFNYKKFNEIGDVVYSNFSSIKCNSNSDIKDLQSMSRAWGNGLIDLEDPQEIAHLEALQSHIDRLKISSKR